MQKIRVRFARNVLGYRAGQVAWVEATPMVETLVRVGALKWLDAPADFDEPAPLVEEAHYVDEDDPGLTDDWLAAVDDGWLDDESP